MRTPLLICLLLVLPFWAGAQSLKGFVTDGESAKPIKEAFVENMATHQITQTDEEGNFLLLAKNGDLIRVSYPGYHPVDHRAVPGTMVRIELYRLSVKMPEFVVHELTKFQKDSVELTALYSSTLNRKPARVGFSNANGGGITGLISTPLQRLTKSYKQRKRFQEQFKKDMEQRYIDTRYTPALVTTLTGLTGESVAVFMNSYPMEHDFARTVSDLELKAWIRNNYKDYKAAK